MDIGTFASIPADLRNSYVSFENESAIAEEESNVHGSSSPVMNMSRRNDYFQTYQTKQKIKVTQSSNFNLMGKRFFQGVKDWGKKCVNLITPEENLIWFADLLKLKTISSDFFFEKYMVVGIADETLSAAQAKSEFSKSLLKPSVLFKEPEMTRQTSNFNEKKYLIDEETVEIIADFCFPNGVPVVRLTDILPGVPLQ